MIEYFVLFGTFLAMFLLAFAAGYLEYRAPRDPGPLPIDLSRVVEPRSEAISFRRSVESLISEQGWVPAPSAESKWISGALAFQKEVEDDQGKFTVLRIDQDVAIPDGSVIESALIVQGNLTSGDGCRFSRWICVKGRCQIGRNNKLAFVASEDELLVGEESEIRSFTDSNSNVTFSDDCSVKGFVGSGMSIAVEGSCDCRRLIGRSISVMWKVGG